MYLSQLRLMCYRNLWTSVVWFLLEELDHLSIGSTRVRRHASPRCERYSYLLSTDSTYHTDVLLRRLVSLCSRMLLSLFRWRWRPWQDPPLVMEVVQPCPSLRPPARLRNKVRTCLHKRLALLRKVGKFLRKFLRNVGKVGKFLRNFLRNVGKVGKFLRKFLRKVGKVGKFPRF